MPAMSLQTDLATIYRRDLTRLVQQIDAFPSEPSLWQTLPGVANSAGNLALHLEGGLREYIGRRLGGVAYTRNRDLEFSSTGIPRPELRARLVELSQSIPAILESLTPEQLEAEYAQHLFPEPITARHLVVHLYGHVGWHLGQIDYLRRILAEAPPSLNRA